MQHRGSCHRIVVIWWNSSESPGLMNRDWILRFVIFVCGNHPHALYYTHATVYSTENSVFVIQPRCRFQCDEELTGASFQGKRDKIVKLRTLFLSDAVVAMTMQVLTFRLYSGLISKVATKQCH